MVGVPTDESLKGGHDGEGVPAYTGDNKRGVALALVDIASLVPQGQNGRQIQRKGNLEWTPPKPALTRSDRTLLAHCT